MRGALAISIAAHAAIAAFLVTRPAPRPRPVDPIEVRLIAPAEPPKVAEAPRPGGTKKGPTARKAAPSKGAGPAIPAPAEAPEVAPSEEAVAETGPAKAPPELDLTLHPKAPPPPDPLTGPVGHLEAKRGPETGVVRERLFDAKIHRDGRLTFDDRASAGVSGSGVHFDLTETVMRALGADPGSYEKWKLAKATEALRQRLWDKSCQENLEKAVLEARTNIEAQLRSCGSVAEKKALLFALWDDCAEDGEDDVVQAGRKIRATIVGIITRELPAGSGHAYSPEELGALNAKRRSHTAFAPYDLFR